ncbi:hypothetical protein Aph02nite_84030 [Actinoplanes philippinensis]|nr:hypothetical protein Aph02nite_84030 [Actinoplanes philippinensis]
MTTRGKAAAVGAVAGDIVAGDAAGDADAVADDGAGETAGGVAAGEVAAGGDGVDSGVPPVHPAGPASISTARTVEVYDFGTGLPLLSTTSAIVSNRPRAAGIHPRQPQVGTAGRRLLRQGRRPHRLGWSAPPESEPMPTSAEDVREPPARRSGSPSTATDHLAIWLRVREQVPWRDVVPHPVTPTAAVHDGYLEFARRRPGLPAAYDDVRARAAAGTPLTTELLARWNGLARGISRPRFRQGDAYAKNGRERYALHAGTEQRFAECVAQAADRAIPVTARSARLHLDIAFFHPFDDGNARLAGLALQFVLRREGVCLDEPVPILTAVRRADDADGAAGLARLVHGIAGATHRRWLRHDAGTVTPRCRPSRSG